MVVARSLVNDARLSDRHRYKSRVLRADAAAARRTGARRDPHKPTTWRSAPPVHGSAIGRVRPLQFPKQLTLTWIFCVCICHDDHSLPGLEVEVTHTGQGWVSEDVNAAAMLDPVVKCCQPVTPGTADDGRSLAKHGDCEAGAGTARDGPAEHIMPRAYLACARRTYVQSVAVSPTLRACVCV